MKLAVFIHRTLFASSLVVATMVSVGCRVSVGVKRTLRVNNATHGLIYLALARAKLSAVRKRK